MWYFYFNENHITNFISNMALEVKKSDILATFQPYMFSMN